MTRFNWKHLVLLLLTIPVIGQIAAYLGRNLADHEGGREAPAAISQPRDTTVRVVVSSHDAEGVTQRDLDLPFLKNLEAFTVERTKLRGEEYLSSQGHPKPHLDVSSEATYVESGRIKLAVIRFRPSDGSFGVLIAGIVGNEFKRVTCIRKSSESIPISYGVCGDKIMDVFGIKIGD